MARSQSSLPFKHAHTHTHTHTHTDLCSRKAFVSIITAYPRVTVKFLVLINVLSAGTKRRVGLDVRGRVGQKERSSLCPSIRLGKKSFGLSLSLYLSLRRVTPCSLLKEFSWDKDDNDSQHTDTHDLDFWDSTLYSEFRSFYTPTRRA